jgi:hypothetical protein
VGCTIRLRWPAALTDCSPSHVEMLPESERERDGETGISGAEAGVAGGCTGSAVGGLSHGEDGRGEGLRTTVRETQEEAVRETEETEEEADTAAACANVQVRLLLHCLFL